MTDQTQTTTEPVAWLTDEEADEVGTLKFATAMKVYRLSSAARTTPQPLAIGLDREAVEGAVRNDLASLRGQLERIAALNPNDQPRYATGIRPFGTGDLRHFIETLRKADTILALAAPADGYVLVPVEPELDADMERDLTESDQEAIERGLRTVRAFDAVHDLRSVLSDTMARQHSGYDWNADPDGMTLRQSEAIKQADRALPAAPTGETGA